MKLDMNVLERVLSGGYEMNIEFRNERLGTRFEQTAQWRTHMVRGGYRKYSWYKAWRCRSIYSKIRWANILHWGGILQYLGLAPL